MRPLVIPFKLRIVVDAILGASNGLALLIDVGIGFKVMNGFFFVICTYSAISGYLRYKRGELG